MPQNIDANGEVHISEMNLIYWKWKNERFLNMMSIFECHINHISEALKDDLRSFLCVDHISEKIDHISEMG